MILTCPQCQTRYQTDPARFGAEGRNVRCARCGHVWLQTAPQPVVEPPPFVPPEETPDAEPAPPPVATAVDSEPEPEPEQEREPEPEQERVPEPVPASRVYAYAPSAPAMDYAPAAPAMTYAPSAEEAPSSPRGDGVRTAAGWVGLVVLVAGLSWSAMHFREEIALLWPKAASFYAAIGKPVNTRGLEIRNVKTVSNTEDGQQVLAISGRLANITSHELSVPPIRITLTDDNSRVLYDWSFSAAVATLKPGEAVNFATRLTGPPLGARHMQVQFADNKE